MNALIIAPVNQWTALRERLNRIGIRATHFINVDTTLDCNLTCVAEVDLVIMDGKEVPESLCDQIRALQWEAHVRVIVPKRLEEEIKAIVRGRFGYD